MAKPSSRLPARKTWDFMFCPPSPDNSRSNNGPLHVTDLFGSSITANRGKAASIQIQPAAWKEMITYKDMYSTSEHYNENRKENKQNIMFISDVINKSIQSLEHYSDVIMNVMASHIASLTIAYWTVYSGADQTKHQSFASLAIVRRIQWWPVNSPQKGPVTRKMFPFDDVIVKPAGWSCVSGRIQCRCNLHSVKISLTAPTHYLNHCWLIIAEVLWHSSDGNFTDAQLVHLWYVFEYH